MLSRTVLVLILLASNAFALTREERVIAGSPADSLEVRHLVLRGTNEEIGRALAEIARDRYAARPEATRDPLRTRAARRYIERNAPLLFERMRGVAAAYNRRLDDDTADFSSLGFTELRAGCSIVHLPPEMTETKTSVVSRDYDFSTGSLNFGQLAPGMLHPTARPYLVELHPDRGYASVAMVAYDLLSGVLDGMNSEGLVVTLAMDDEIFESKQMEPTYGPATGLGVLQTLRLLLDTAANVDEAKEILLQTKQYYEYVPCHFLIADRFGKSFVWEYSALHNAEHIIENPGKALVMTNFTLSAHMDGEHPPTPELAKATCRRYSYLADKLASGPVSEDVLRKVHRAVDAQGREQNRPPIRTFWHALYSPERREARYSYYLGDDPAGTIRRSDYVTVQLTSTTKSAAAAPATVAAPAPKPAGDTIAIDPASDVATVLPEVVKTHPNLRVVQLAGTNVTDADLAHLRGLAKLEQLGLKGTAVTGAGLAHLTGLRSLTIVNLANTKLTDAEMPVLAKITGMTGLNLANTKITDAALVHLKTMPRLTKLTLTGTAVTDAGVADAKKWLPFWAKVTR